MTSEAGGKSGSYDKSPVGGWNGQVMVGGVSTCIPGFQTTPFSFFISTAELIQCRKDPSCAIFEKQDIPPLNIRSAKCIFDAVFLNITKHIFEKVLNSYIS